MNTADQNRDKDGQPALRVLLVEDDPMVLEIHDTLVSSVPGFEVVGHAATGGRLWT